MFPSFSLFFFFFFFLLLFSSVHLRVRQASSPLLHIDGSKLLIHQPLNPSIRYFIKFSGTGLQTVQNSIMPSVHNPMPLPTFQQAKLMGVTKALFLCLGCMPNKGFVYSKYSSYIRDLLAGRVAL